MRSTPNQTTNSCHFNPSLIAFSLVQSYSNAPLGAHYIEINIAGSLLMLNDIKCDRFNDFSLVWLSFKEVSINALVWMDPSSAVFHGVN